MTTVEDMTTVCFQYGSEVICEYTTNPPCNIKNKGPCDPCSELIGIEAQIQELHLRLRDLYAQQRLVRRKRNNIHCFINNLPYDIASYIFVLCLPPIHPSCMPGDEEPLKISTPSLPLQVASVTYSWRALALSTPELWSRLSIQVDAPDFTSLNRRLQRSGSAPLLIRLHDSDTEILDDACRGMIQDVTALIKQNLYRIGYLCIDLTSDPFKVFKKGFDLDRPDAAPLLQKLHIHNITATKRPKFHFSISTQPPSPRRVSMFGSIANKCHLNWEHISHLTLISTTFNNLSILLSKANFLVNLYLGLRNIDDDINDESMHSLPMINHRSIQDMTLRNSREDSKFLIFSHSKLTSLENLTIRTVYSSTFPSFSIKFLAFLNRSACYLKFLDMTLRAPSTTTMEMLGDVLQGIPTIQEFRLRIVKRPRDLGIEPFLKRLCRLKPDVSLGAVNTDSSSQRVLLPFLHKFYLEGTSPACLGLVLDVMTSRTASSQIFQLMDHLAVHYDDAKFELKEDDLQRILQLRAAGKSVFVYVPRWDPQLSETSTCDLVKLAMET